MKKYIFIIFIIFISISCGNEKTESQCYFELSECKQSATQDNFFRCYIDYDGCCDTCRVSNNFCSGISKP